MKFLFLVTVAMLLAGCEPHPDLSISQNREWREVVRSAVAIRVSSTESAATSVAYIRASKQIELRGAMKSALAWYSDSGDCIIGVCWAYGRPFVLSRISARDGRFIYMAYLQGPTSNASSASAEDRVLVNGDLIELYSIREDGSYREIRDLRTGDLIAQGQQNGASPFPSDHVHVER